MKKVILLLAGLGLAAPAFAAPSVPVKCAANEERVWVYSNLATWDVSARLKCGTQVEVLGVEKGYVQVRTADGNEGYVPLSALPSSELSQMAAATASAPVMTVAAAARANVQAGSAQPMAEPPAAQAISSNRTTAAPAPAEYAVRVAEAAPSAPPPAVPAQGAPVPPSNVMPPIAPAPVPDTAPAEQNRPALPQVPAPAQAPIPAPAQSSPARVAMASATSQRAAIVVTSAPTTNSNVVSAATAKVSATAIAPSQPTVAMVAEPRTEAKPVRTAAPATRENATLVIENVSEPVLVTTQEPATTVKPAKYMTITRKSRPASVRTPEFSDDDLDLPATNTAASEDLSACSVYFSAYGVTPMQYKWIADERGKRFPGVCPAPEPSMVDYVVIFTHDMNYFTTTLPEAIHTDRNGFSDWSPVTSVDDTQIPVSLLDRARHEYAWVFRVHRGTFDPGDFTSRRRPQYTKTESRSSKSIEDAMEFMADSSPAQ